MSTSMEQLVRMVRATTSFWSPQFTMQQLSEGLNDADQRIIKLEVSVKALATQIAALKPPSPPPAAKV